MDNLYAIQQFRKAARLQRHATIIAGLAARQADGLVNPVAIVRQARLIDAEIFKQSEADPE